MITPLLEWLYGSIERETINMLKSAVLGEGSLLGITEDIGGILSLEYAQILKTITTTVTKHGKCPIAES